MLQSGEFFPLEELGFCSELDQYGVNTHLSLTSMIWHKSNHRFVVHLQDQIEPYSKCKKGSTKQFSTTSQTTRCSAAVDEAVQYRAGRDSAVQRCKKQCKVQHSTARQCGAVIQEVQGTAQHMKKVQYSTVRRCKEQCNVEQGETVQCRDARSARYSTAQEDSAVQYSAEM